MGLSSAEPEKTGTFTFVGIEKTFVPPSDTFDSFAGEGGFVFKFGTDLKLKNEVDPATGANINTSLK
mgnify:CR=1 FL=1